MNNNETGFTLYIIMPVLNCLQMTKDAFDSIVVDCSTCFVLIDQDSDSTMEDWAKKMMEIKGVNRSFVYVKNSPRIALASAWNQGVNLALKDPACKYIAILNNDIVLHKKTLIHLMRFMDKTGYLLVTADNIKDRMSLEVMKSMELPMHYTDYDCQPINDWRAEGPDFSCFMISPETVKVIGLFDQNYEGAYCEDQDCHIRIRRAYTHIKQHNDKNIDAERVHAKRLSTAPYYHYASQTLTQNIAARHDIAIRHGKNIEYYLKKWGASHPDAMDGKGNIQPFGDALKDWRNW